MGAGGTDSLILTSALEDGELSASPLSHFNPRQRASLLSL